MSSDETELSPNSILIVTHASDQIVPRFETQELGPVEPGEYPLFGFTRGFISDYGVLYGNDIRIGVNRFQSLGYNPDLKLYIGKRL